MIVLLLVLSLFTQTAFPVFADETVDKMNMTELEVSRDLLSLTEARTVEVQADLGEAVDLSQIEFQFGRKNISKWKQWTSKTNTFDGDPYITVIDEPHYIDGTTVVEATLQFGLLFGTDNLSNRTIRVQYQQFIDDYELAIVHPESGIKAATTVKLNVYDEFLFTNN